MNMVALSKSVSTAICHVDDATYQAAIAKSGHWGLLRDSSNNNHFNRCDVELHWFQVSEKNLANPNPLRYSGLELLSIFLKSPSVRMHEFPVVRPNVVNLGLVSRCSLERSFLF